MIVAAAAMARYLAAGRRAEFVRAVTVASVLFIGSLAAFVAPEVDAYRAPKRLVAESGADCPDREIRLATYEYTQPSVTYYAGRKVDRLVDAAAATRFLAMPLPAYLFVPEKIWDGQLAGKVPTPHRVAARRFDLLRNGEVLVVTNEGADR